MTGYHETGAPGQEGDLPPSRFGAGYTVGPSTPEPDATAYGSPMNPYGPIPAYAPTPVPGTSYPAPHAPSEADSGLRYPVPQPAPMPMAPPVGMPLYPAGPPMVVYGAPRQTNSMAIAALVCSLVFAPLGIVFGHIALTQISRTGDDGRGLAIAGLVIGYLFTGFLVLYVFLVGAFFAALV